MKQLFGNSEFGSYRSKTTKALMVAALATLLVGCGGGGDDSAPSSQNAVSEGNSSLEQAVLGVVCLLVSRGNVGCLDNDGFSVPEISTTSAPGSDEPVCHGPERCIEGSTTAYAQAIDVEPNDNISTASAASFPTPHDPELKVGFFANGTINNLTDGIDTYAFTAARARTFVFRVCGGTFGDRCEDRGLDVAIAHFSILDQFGTVLLSSRGDAWAGNYQQMRIDAGVLYYVMVVAENTANVEQAYSLRVSEALTQSEPDLPQEPAPQPDTAPPVLASPSVPPVGLLVTLDWMPPTMNVDGSPLLDLAGYNVYFGSLSGVYTDFRALDNPGLVTYMLDLPGSGSWHIAITAYDSAGNESDFSNEVVVDVICECDLPPAEEML